MKHDPGQLSLMELPTVAHARHSDPATSHDAAARITPDLPSLQGLVYFQLRRAGPCTDRQLVTICKAKYGRTDSTWRTRRAELVQKGLVEKVGVVEGHSLWKVIEP